ncbi:sodium-dependent transporter [Marinilactibacillus sp. XAAS-LB27]|uniref:sodium-dependent transporter n=1 Tax=Marinilactibacillus sp. XAAS-LB27 TaxID=3114538 RepID=UPI002E18E0E2|nr:sodium-dependent transporter [Marinilactibacillus sp. XAAS-LB27]
MKKEREQWGSRWGFILAAMGSAVGLGNIWRFSYAMGAGGGSTFLIIYLLSVLIIGFPVMLIEFAIGRRAQTDAIDAFKKLAPKSFWVVAGGMGVLAAFVILSFYGVIGGWSFKYIFSYLTGGVSGNTGDYFGEFVGSPIEPIGWQFLFMGVTVAIVMLGVQKGIETSSKWMMPILSILLILLAGYSLTLGGASEALTFMFHPDWSAFGDPNVYFAAVGQAFFTLSLGMGIMLTYGSYLSPKETLTSSAAYIIILDTLFAIIAGLVVFPALFAFDLDPTQGAGLVFVVLPTIFQNISGIGAVVGVAFFVLLALAALSSAISLLEVVVAYLIRRLGVSRKIATLGIGFVIFLVGVPSSLSQGAVSIEVFGDSFLDFMDKFSGNLLLPLGGLIIALYGTWSWKSDELLEHTDLKGNAFAPAILFFAKYVAPIAILIILVFGMLNW